MWGIGEYVCILPADITHFKCLPRVSRIQLSMEKNAIIFILYISHCFPFCLLPGIWLPKYKKFFFQIEIFFYGDCPEDKSYEICGTRVIYLSGKMCLLLLQRTRVWFLAARWNGMKLPGVILDLPGQLFYIHTVCKYIDTDIHINKTNLLKNLHDSQSSSPCYTRLLRIQLFR